MFPNDALPKNKAPSIWSVDSGYASNTLEDDEAFEVDYIGSSATPQTSPPATQQPISLGPGGYWNIHVEDQLRLKRPECAIQPVTTKLNVFTTKDGSKTDFILPTCSSKPDTCIACQLWSITNPGDNLKCDECRDKTFDAPGTLHYLGKQPKAKFAVPRLRVPDESQSKMHPKSELSTRCSACEISSLIDSSHTASCASCGPDPNFLSPVSPSKPPKVRRSCARRPPTKLQVHALRCLRGWLRDNQNDPYPDADTKRSLAQECGITEKQVNTWFTNARARQMTRVLDPSNQVSEDDGAFESGFSSVASTPICKSTIPFSQPTPFNLPCSDSPTPAVNGPNQTTSARSRKGKKKDYSRINTVSPINHETSLIPPTPGTTPDNHIGTEQETWQCTFCYQHVAPKSWRRHEETQHRPKRRWTCLLNGPQLTLPSRSGTSMVCAFCMDKNPSEEHFLRTHRIVECMKKSEEERTFLRPDHLRQHVKNFHKSTLWEIVRDGWRRDEPDKDEIDSWVCGFCGQDLKTWEMRETHIAGHFKDGLTMADRGNCRDSDSTIPEARNKRRNSCEEPRSMFTKLARTLTGRSNRQQHQHPSKSQFANDFDPVPAFTATPVPVAPLLSDMGFDSFMADFYDPITTISSGQHSAPDNSYDSTFPNEEDMELDFDAIAKAFINDSSMDFEGVWDQQRQG